MITDAHVKAAYAAVQDLLTKPHGWLVATDGRYTTRISEELILAVLEGALTAGPMIDLAKLDLMEAELALEDALDENPDLISFQSATGHMVDRAAIDAVVAGLLYKEPK